MRWSLQRGPLVAYAGPILALAFAGIQGFDILTYPLVNHDTALLNDAGWQLVKTGHFRADVLSQNPGFEDHYFWQPPALALSAAGSYWLFGFGIWQTRLPSIVFGALGILAIFEFVRSLRPSGIGALIAAASLFFLSPWVITAKDSRMDTGAILALLVGTRLAMGAVGRNEPKISTFFAAGVCVSLAALFHTAAVTWAVGLLVVIVAFHPKRPGLAVAYSAGASLLIAAWLLYGLQYPIEFNRQYVALLVDRTSHVGVLQRLSGEVLRYLSTFARAPTVCGMLLLGIYGLVANSLWHDLRIRSLMVLAGLVSFFSAIAVGGKSSGFYDLYPITLFLCLIAIGLEECLTMSRGRGPWLRIATITCVAAFVINSAALSLGPRFLAFRYQGVNRDYALQLAPLSHLLKEGDQVWGSVPIWFAVVKAGARLDALEPVPPWRMTRPDSHRHRFVVVDRGKPFEGSGDYFKIAEFGSDLRHVLRAPLASKSYAFDLWQSRFMN